jgi:hypothetical protein
MLSATSPCSTFGLLPVVEHGKTFSILTDLFCKALPSCFGKERIMLLSPFKGLLELDSDLEQGVWLIPGFSDTKKSEGLLENRSGD